MPKVLVIHGAGMNMRGKAQIEVFGPMKLPEYDKHIRKYASELGIKVEIFHSNIEGEVINTLLRRARRRGGWRDHQPGRLHNGPSCPDRGHRAGEIPDHRAAHLQSGAARPGVGNRLRRPRRGHRLRHLRVLARPTRHPGDPA